MGVKILIERRALAAFFQKLFSAPRIAFTGKAQRCHCFAKSTTDAKFKFQHPPEIKTSGLRCIRKAAANTPGGRCNGFPISAHALTATPTVFFSVPPLASFFQALGARQEKIPSGSGRFSDPGALLPDQSSARSPKLP
jgi:hypothetical protein